MSLVALGKAYELTYVRDGRSTEKTVRIPGHWWAWTGDADNGSILLVKPVGFHDFARQFGPAAVRQSQGSQITFGANQN